MFTRGYHQISDWVNWYNGLGFAPTTEDMIPIGKKALQRPSCVDPCHKSTNLECKLHLFFFVSQNWIELVVKPDSEATVFLPKKTAAHHLFTGCFPGTQP